MHALVHQVLILSIIVCRVCVLPCMNIVSIACIKPLFLLSINPNAEGALNDRHATAFVEVGDIVHVLKLSRPNGEHDAALAPGWR